MLKSLQIRDYALIEKVFVEFGKGLNIITGETGAGKSILIDAMGLLLGERASTEVVRKGAQKSIVEAVFDVDKDDKVRQILESVEVEHQSELILRREISLKGSNRCFINDTPVSLSTVKDVGNLLVDLHGQHEHQSLLRTETHIEMLDDFGRFQDDLNNYLEHYRNLSHLQNELKSLREKEELLREKKELYSFQIKEIDRVSPEAGEEEKLSEELIILENAEKLMESTSGLYTELYESENAVYDILVRIKNELSSLSSIDKTFQEIEGECHSAITLVNDIAEFVRSYRTRIDVEPQRLETVRERLGAFSMIKKKYGGSIDKVLEYRQKIGNEYELAENFTDSMEKLQQRITEEQKLCGTLAKLLSEKRAETAKQIEKDVIEALKYLGMPDSVFVISIRQIHAEQNSTAFIISEGQHFKYNHYGFDEVEFFISTNAGEDPKPLVKVASGGEISRIMLALKTILAKNDRLPLLIFDEIDTGVSGRIAQKVGHTLKSLAAFHQIISITHLPQIAGLADHHFMVEKKNVEGRVVSSISYLDNEGRVREVAKLMSGEEITDASLKGARELMGGRI